ncbi:hypothetical protein HDU83_005226, partial [Entophlyctis luteolus]
QHAKSHWRRVSRQQLVTSAAHTSVSAEQKADVVPAGRSADPAQERATGFDARSPTVTTAPYHSASDAPDAQAVGTLGNVNFLISDGDTRVEPWCHHTKLSVAFLCD